MELVADEVIQHIGVLPVRLHNGDDVFRHDVLDEPVDPVELQDVLSASPEQDPVQRIPVVVDRVGDLDLADSLAGAIGHLDRGQ